MQEPGQPPDQSMKPITSRAVFLTTLCLQDRVHTRALPQSVAAYFDRWAALA